VKTGALVFDNPVPICCMCSIPFETGVEYLVYAYEDRQRRPRHRRSFAHEDAVRRKKQTCARWEPAKQKS